MALYIQSLTDFQKRQIMLKLRDIMRSGHIVRWNSVKHGRPQYLAEHHYMVTMVARALARAILTPEYYTKDRQILLVDYCLNHDLPEILTGDASSNFKRKLESMLGTDDNVFKLLDYEIHPPLKKLDDQMNDTPLAQISKLADWADAIVYLQQEGADNSEIKTSQTVMNAFIGFIPDGVMDKELVKKEMESFFNKPISHSHGIELKLKDAFNKKVELASKKYPEFNWHKANEILLELLEGENSSIKFEY